MEKKECLLTSERSTLALFLTAILSLSLVGFVFFFFIVNRGGTGTSLNICVASLALLMVTGTYNPLKYRYVLWTVLTASAIALMSFLIPWGNPDHGTAFLFLRVLFIVLAIHYLSTLKVPVLMLFHRYAVLALLSGIVLWQFFLCIIRHDPFGAYSNPHYLSNVSILTLPLIFFFFTALERRGKIFVCLLGLLDVITLISTSSRPAWLSIILSSLFGILIFYRGRKKWIGLSALGGGIVLLLAVDGKVKERIMDLVRHIGQEERLQLYKDAVVVLKKSVPAEWLFGHGIGSIRKIRYPSYPALTFPHNFFLEIIYDNGLTGMVMMTVPLICLLVILLKGVRILERKEERIFLGCLTILFFAWFFHASIVFPFYSKYSMYPFSLILGCMIAFGEKVRSLKRVPFEHEKPE